MARAQNIVRIIFSEEAVVCVYGDLQELQKDLYDAVDNGGWLLIQPEDGPRVSINPAQIRYMEELTPREAAQAKKNGTAPRKQPARQGSRSPAGARS